MVCPTKNCESYYQPLWIRSQILRRWKFFGALAVWIALWLRYKWLRAPEGWCFWITSGSCSNSQHLHYKEGWLVKIGKQKQESNPPAWSDKTSSDWAEKRYFRIKLKFRGTRDLETIAPNSVQIGLIVEKKEHADRQADIRTNGWTWRARDVFLVAYLQKWTKKNYEWHAAKNFYKENMSVGSRIETCGQTHHTQSSISTLYLKSAKMQRKHENMIHLYLQLIYKTGW